MTLSHLFFAVATTAYILVAIQLEERDLLHVHGGQYADYRRRVSMLLPLPRREPGAEAGAAPSASPGAPLPER
jgi:protein-S-isoprenylcysteine O-methyltransferase Ste14